MAILSICQVPEQDQASSQGPAPGATGTIVSKAVLVYRIQFDPKTFSQAQAYNIEFGTVGPGADGVGTVTLPTYLQALGALFCTGVEIRRKKNHFCDDLYTFVSPAVPTAPGKHNIMVCSDYEESTEHAVTWGDGTLIINSNGDIYSGGLPKVYYDQNVSVEFDTNSVEAGTLAAAHRKVNSDAISMTVNGVSQTFEVNTLKLKAQWKTTYADTANSPYQFHVSLCLTYRSEFMPGTTTQIGWAKPVPNMGYRRFVSSVPQMDAGKINYIDLKLLPITTPIYLHVKSGNQIDTTGGAPVQAQFFPTTAKLMEDTIAFAPLLTGIS